MGHESECSSLATPPLFLVSVLTVGLVCLHRASQSNLRKSSIILAVFHSIPLQLQCFQMFNTAVLAEVVNDTQADRIQIDSQNLC